MKHTGNKVFFFMIAVFLGLVFVRQYFSPKEFVWQESYDKYSRQPFGSYVFDDVVSSSVESYEVVEKTFYSYYYDEKYATCKFGDEEDAYIIVPPGDYAAEDDEEYDMYDEENGIEEYEDFGGPYDEDVVPLPPEKRCALLVTNRYIPFSDADMMALMFLLRQGNRVMMCLESFPYALCDSLCFTTGSSQSRHSFFYGIEQYVAKGYTRDSLFFGTDTLHPEHVCEVYPPLHSRILRQSADVYYGIDSTRHDLNRIRCDSLEVLACDAAGDTVALRLFIGEGELFLVSTPLMFTNYGILDGGNASYAFRLLSYLKGMPLVRLEAGEAGETGRAGGTKTPLRYVLSQPPLRWALYASLVLIVIFMIFTARRRQRVIPVVRPPANETLRFTRLIGNLYYRKSDCKDILNKKYLYFSAELKRITGLDLQSDERDEALSRRLAEKTGQNSAIVWPAFRELKYLLRDEATVSESDMIHHIDRMNEWIGFLS